jgi:hypothetical protein
MFALKGANLPMPFLRKHLFPGRPLIVFIEKCLAFLEVKDLGKRQEQIYLALLHAEVV